MKQLKNLQIFQKQLIIKKYPQIEYFFIILDTLCPNGTQNKYDIHDPGKLSIFNIYLSNQSVIVNLENSKMMLPQSQLYKAFLEQTGRCNTLVYTYTH